MALKITGWTKVKTLKSDFKSAFGLTIRVYDGKSFADEEATLASIRKNDNKGGELSPQRNMKVGNFEDKLLEIFGIKTQVSGSDDSYLCKDEFTLAKALEEDTKKMARKDKKASRQSDGEDSDNKSAENKGSMQEKILSKFNQVLEIDEEWIYDEEDDWWQFLNGVKFNSKYEELSDAEDIEDYLADFVSEELINKLKDNLSTQGYLDLWTCDIATDEYLYTIVSVSGDEGQFVVEASYSEDQELYDILADIVKNNQPPTRV